MTLRTFHKEIFTTLEGKKKTPAKQFVDIFLSTMVALNIVAIILSSVASLSGRLLPLFLAFEIFSVIIFSIEYLLRVWSSGKISFALRPLMIVDLLAIIPFYLVIFSPGAFEFTRVAQILRLFRIFKMERYFEEGHQFLQVIRSKVPELKIMIYVLSILILISSSLLYFVENPVQPSVFSSIPTSAYWAVMTFTTVGYGDMVPVTGLGRLLAALTALMGIGFFALPAGIISAGFISQAFSNHRGVAQLASARRSGRRGRGFKSRHSDH